MHKSTLEYLEYHKSDLSRKNLFRQEEMQMYIFLACWPMDTLKSEDEFDGTNVTKY